MNSSNGYPLLCELHSHTRWSDGRMTTRELVDLYAHHGFDVLCITDHVVRDGGMVTRDNHGDYLADVRREARRAHELYDMLVIPGLELTWDDADGDWSAHAVAVGLESYVGLDGGLEAALCEARDHGAAVIAAHPHGIETDPNDTRLTRWWWLDRRLRALAHRFELVNRHQVFAWVAAEGLPSVASGDAHVPAHVATWKTLLPCARTAADVVDCLRSSEPTAITRFQPSASATQPAAGTLLRAG
ncbi:MAG: PHP domain-containing protein [Gaiellales bacterium]